MTGLTVAAVSAPFGRDLDDAYARIGRLIEDARARGVQLLVLPEACLGGYLADLDGAAPLPPALDLDGPELRRIVALAGDVVVCLGLCERDGDNRYNTAVCLDGSGILGVHRKVHQPLGENASYSAGSTFAAFDTPVGRIGMMICYDKAFPEAARALALDGAEVIAVLSAWPAGRTNRHPDLAQDRWTMRFDLFDRARALENQVVLVASNQWGSFGDLRFVGSAKVVGPGGDVLATTGVAAGMAVVQVDVEHELEQARRGMFHLRDRRPQTYDIRQAVGA